MIYWPQMDQWFLACTYSLLDKRKHCDVSDHVNLPRLIPKTHLGQIRPRPFNPPWPRCVSSPSPVHTWCHPEADLSWSYSRTGCGSRCTTAVCRVHGSGTGDKHTRTYVDKWSNHKSWRSDRNEKRKTSFSKGMKRRSVTKRPCVETCFKSLSWKSETQQSHHHVEMLETRSQTRINVCVWCLLSDVTPQLTSWTDVGLHPENICTRLHFSMLHPFEPFSSENCCSSVVSTKWHVENQRNCSFTCHIVSFFNTPLVLTCWNLESRHWWNKVNNNNNNSQQTWRQGLYRNQNNFLSPLSSVILSVCV